MSFIRKMIILGAAKKIFDMVSKRRHVKGNAPAGAGPSLAAHSKDSSTRVPSGQNRAASEAKGVR